MCSLPLGIYLGSFCVGFELTLADLYCNSTLARMFKNSGNGDRHQPQIAKLVVNQTFVFMMEQRGFDDRADVEEYEVVLRAAFDEFPQDRKRKETYHARRADGRDFDDDDGDDDKDVQTEYHGFVSPTLEMHATWLPRVQSTCVLQAARVHEHVDAFLHYVPSWVLHVELEQCDLSRFSKQSIFDRCTTQPHLTQQRPRVVHPSPVPPRFGSVHPNPLSAEEYQTCRHGVLFNRTVDEKERKMRVANLRRRMWRLEHECMLHAFPAPPLPSPGPRRERKVAPA